MSKKRIFRVVLKQRGKSKRRPVPPAVAEKARPYLERLALQKARTLADVALETLKSLPRLGRRS